MKDRTPHLCRNALGTAICASNGIGPSQDADRRIEHCVICGRWWKIYAVSPYLTVWVEVPAWMIWLFWHRIWKTDHKSSHGKEPSARRRRQQRQGDRRLFEQWRLSQSEADE